VSIPKQRYASLSIVAMLVLTSLINILVWVPIEGDTGPISLDDGSIPGEQKWRTTTSAQFNQGNLTNVTTFEYYDGALMLDVDESGGTRSGGEIEGPIPLTTATVQGYVWDEELFPVAWSSIEYMDSLCIETDMTSYFTDTDMDGYYSMEVEYGDAWSDVLVIFDNETWYGEEWGNWEGGVRNNIWVNVTVALAGWTVQGYVFDDGMSVIPDSPSNSINITTDAGLWQTQTDFMGYYQVTGVYYNMWDWVNVSYNDGTYVGYVNETLNMDPMEIHIYCELGPAPVHGYIYNDMAMPIAFSPPDTVRVITDAYPQGWTVSTDENGFFECYDAYWMMDPTVTIEYFDGYWKGSESGMFDGPDIDVYCMPPVVYGTIFDDGFQPIWNSPGYTLQVRTDLDTWVSHTNSTGGYAFHNVTYFSNSSVTVRLNDGTWLGIATGDLAMAPLQLDLYCSWGVYGTIFDGNPIPITNSPSNSIEITSDNGVWTTETDADGYYQMDGITWDSDPNLTIYFCDEGAWYGYGYTALTSGSEQVDIYCSPLSMPSAPQNLQAIGDGTWINLTWEAPGFDGGSEVLGYRILRGMASGGESYLNEIGIRLWYNDTGLVPGNTYYYYVKAYNIVGYGQASNEVSITTQAPPPTGHWWVDGEETQDGVTWTISGDIIVNGTGSLTITDSTIISGTVTVRSGGYLKLTASSLDCGHIIVESGASFLADPSWVNATGNLWIDGEYTLDDTILQMDCAFNGQYNIYVNNTGTFNVIAKSVIRIKSAGRYILMVNDGASFWVENSIIRDCGWDHTNRGVVVMADFAYFNNATFVNNYNGLTIWSWWCEIYNSTFEGNINNGLVLIGSQYTCINNTEFTGNPHGMYLYLAENNTIEDCHSYLNNMDGFFVYQSHNNFFYQVNSSFNMINGVHNWNSNGNEFWNCQVYHNQDEGFMLSNADDTDIYHCNIVKNNEATYGIWLNNSHYNEISYNDIRNNMKGIFLDYSDYNEVYNNNVTNHDGGGILLWHAYMNMIVQNNVTNNNLDLVGESGIYVSASERNALRGNNISSNQQYGILIYESDNITLEYNQICNTTGRGIRAEDSHGHFYRFNDISDNTISGIEMTVCDYIVLNCTNINRNGATGGIYANLCYDVYILNSEIIDNQDNGMTFDNDCNEIFMYNVTIHSNDFDGIQMFSSWNITVVNSTISANVNADLCHNSNSHISLVNCTFGSTSFTDTDSRLYVHNYLHVRVQQNFGKPIAGAEYTIYNLTANEVYSGYSKMSGWDSWIPLLAFVESQSGTTMHTMHNIEASILGLTGSNNAILFSSTTVTITIDIDKYFTSGTYTSPVYNAGFCAYWTWIEWEEELTFGTDITVQTRSGNSQNVTGSWPPWSSTVSTASGSGITSPPITQFFQFRVHFNSADRNRTPVLHEITVHYSRRPTWVKTGMEDFQSGYLVGNLNISGNGDIYLGRKPDLIVNKDMTLGGSYIYNRIYFPDGYRITIDGDIGFLELNANKIFINGTLYGSGIINGAGDDEGKGLGGTAADSNSGGGGGGGGGHDSTGGSGGVGGGTSTFGVAGQAYSSEINSQFIEPGSQGGEGGDGDLDMTPPPGDIGIGGTGGLGGGAVTLRAARVEIDGTIDMSGSDGNNGMPAADGGGGGGGGSGGSILIIAKHIVTTMYSHLYVNGGNGGNGGNEAAAVFGGYGGGGGGGGAGGRIKMFYESSCSRNGAEYITGGSGGSGGTGDWGGGSTGLGGSDGTIYVSMGQFMTNYIIGKEIDSGENDYDWRALQWQSSIPANTNIQFYTRTRNEGGSWSAWSQVNSPISSPPGRFLQWRALLSSSNPGATPILGGVITLGNTNQASAVASITLDVFIPDIVEYALLDSSWNVISDNTTDGLIDVGQLYYFNATIKHQFGFGLIDNVTITAWHDMGNDANIYNSTHGANLNMMFRYQNDSSTGDVGEFFMEWNGTHDETILHISQCMDIEHPTIANARMLTWAFTPGKQIRAAKGPLAAGGVEGFNDLNSWNFNITAYDDLNINSTPIEDEFGVYKYVEVTADNDPSGAGRPGMLAPLSPSMNITSSANYRFNLNVSINNLTDGTNNISAEQVEMFWTSDGGGTTYGWRAFSFSNESYDDNYTDYYYGSDAIWQSPFVNGSFNTTVVNWRVDIPVAQPEGTYTSPVYIRIEADTV